MVTQEDKDVILSFENTTERIPVVDEEMPFNNGISSCTKQKGRVRKKVNINFKLIT